MSLLFLFWEALLGAGERWLGLFGWVVELNENAFDSLALPLAPWLVLLSIAALKLLPKPRLRRSIGGTR